jgi:hypothetical protein
MTIRGILCFHVNFRIDFFNLCDEYDSSLWLKFRWRVHGTCRLLLVI